MTRSFVHGPAESVGRLHERQCGPAVRDDPQYRREQSRRVAAHESRQHAAENRTTRTHQRRDTLQHPTGKARDQ